MRYTTILGNQTQSKKVILSTCEGNQLSPKRRQEQKEEEQRERAAKGRRHGKASGQPRKGGENVDRDRNGRQRAPSQGKAE